MSCSCRRSGSPFSISRGHGPQAGSRRRRFRPWLDAAVIGAVQRRVYIGEAKHGGHLPIATRIEPAFAHELGRVAERAEQDVPERQIGEVVVMKTEPMMHAVRLRPLQ